jgi:hypothetical protein
MKFYIFGLLAIAAFAARAGPVARCQSQAALVRACRESWLRYATTLDR